MNEAFDVIARKLAEHEMALSEMYAQFACTFAQDAALWNELSRDEVRHAGWIERLRQSVAAGTIEPAETTARPQAAAMAIQYARTLSARCESGNLTRRQAHALARDIENGMLDRSFFRALGGTSPEFKDLQAMLNKETAAHRERIVAALGRLPAAAG